MVSSNLPISPLFTARKEKILSALSVPADSYTDLSPKGSVDVGIIDLIDEINAIDGLVTTSSCAGRISVFLEGSKNHGDEAGEDGVATGVPGGKGMGGRWLFVSHDPVRIPEGRGEVLKMLGMREGAEGAGGGLKEGDGRLVRFQFEPMILHIQTASLQHASPILSAALNAGFRESGLQSLKALEDPHALPMVAIRTAGLCLSSVVGRGNESEDTNHDGPEALVSEEYLRMMLQLGNERFVENTKRIERFRSELSRALERKGGENGEWEKKSVRAERMRREGLARREAQRETETGKERELQNGAQDSTTKDGIGEDLLLPEG